MDIWRNLTFINKIKVVAFLLSIYLLWITSIFRRNFMFRSLLEKLFISILIMISSHLGSTKSIGKLQLEQGSKISVNGSVNLFVFKCNKNRKNARLLSMLKVLPWFIKIKGYGLSPSLEIIAQVSKVIFRRQDSKLIAVFSHLKTSFLKKNQKKKKKFVRKKSRKRKFQKSKVQ